MSTIVPLAVTSPSDNSFIAPAREKAVELEGVFLNTLVKQMMSGLDSDNGFGGGQGEQTWRSLQSEFLADSIAQSGGIGLADDILASLLRQQEAAFIPAFNPSSEGNPS